MPNTVIADGKDAAKSLNTKLSEDLRFMALYCVADFFSVVGLINYKKVL